MSSNGAAEVLNPNLLVTREVVDGVAILILDNPPVNALSRDLREAIRHEIAALSTDENVTAIVLMGGNGTFIASADLREFGKPLSNPTLTDVIENDIAESLDGLVRAFRINWVWMPPWTPERITDDGRDMMRALGFAI